MAIKEKKTLECKCNKCGYKWQARLDVPVMCPKCKSRKWND